MNRGPFYNRSVTAHDSIELKIRMQLSRMGLWSFYVMYALCLCGTQAYEYDPRNRTDTYGNKNNSYLLHNVTGMINSLLDGYDIRLRPSFGVKPLRIGMDVKIASFDSISEVNMDYTITLYLNQYWQDERLKFTDDNVSLTLTGDFAEKIWVPDTFFANDKNSFLHDVTEKNKMIRLYGDGTIVYGMRFTTTLACMMDLHYYPLDVQNCTVEIESYGYTMQDVAMYWRYGEDSVEGIDKVELPQFTMEDYRTLDKVEQLLTGEYQRLSLSFKLQRNIGFFIFQTYLPSILIVMLSWVSFWINHEATSARVALGITTVLTMTTISNGVRQSLPRISYVKAIDIYLVMCFVFVFAALLEYAAVNYTYWGARAKKKAKKLRERSMRYTERTTEENQVCEREPHDIIEMKDIRMSPIPGLRNQQNPMVDSEDSDKSVPTFRMTPVIPRTYMRGGQIHTQVYRRKSSTASMQKKRKLLSSVKERAKSLKVKIPKVQDVNTIDKYSRFLFPSLFVLFNLCYWGFCLI